MSEPISEQFTFQTEAKELLQLMIHSVYSNKEIFLRELISNASDALDKLRFEALSRPELSPPEPAITLSIDKAARTLTLSDNGVGMSKDEVIANIGTIARSGTKEFLERAKDGGKQVDLIGQFGVGFYSCFMVAERVELTTRRAGTAEAVLWTSTGDGQYQLQPAQKDSPGTTIVLHLRPADLEDKLADFTDEAEVTRVVKHHSDFITYPIRLGDKQLNSQKPIWARPANEVGKDEYDEFYRHISHDWEPPQLHALVRAEGTFEYQALLYLPAHAPRDLFFREGKRGLQLYVRRVLILEQCEDLLPSYLRFVRGVVDSADLPLNVSREILQQNRQITQIRKHLAKKIVDTLVQLQQTEADKYLKVWHEFGALLKEGFASDADNRERLQDLLLFQSSADKEKLTTLKEYVLRMPAEQEAIYYICGDSRVAVEHSPHLEALAEKNFEVLFFTEPVDELLVQELHEFSGKPLQSAAKGSGAKIVDIDPAPYKPFFERLQKALDSWVKEVRLSSRLRSSPACLVGDENDLSPHLQRLLEQAQRLSVKPKRILELNPKHAAVEKLKARFDLVPNDAEFDDRAYLLFGQAILAEGSTLPDPARFSRLVAELLSK